MRGSAADAYICCTVFGAADGRMMVMQEVAGRERIRSFHPTLSDCSYIISSR